MRVLVTGHRGYIGSVLMPMMTSEGHEAVGLDSDLYRECTFGTSMNTTKEIIKDIRDIEIHDLQGFDAILHLAGLSNDPLGDLDPDLTHEINSIASVRLAHLAKKAGISRYVFSSSCSNYGASDDTMLDENSELKPVTPYGRSKVFVEEEVRKLADSKFSPTFLRNATAYGVSPRLRFDLVVNNLVAWAFTTGKVYIKSDGTPWRPIVHIEDIGKAFISVINAPREQIHNQIFNVGITSENYQIRDLAEIVEQEIPGTHLEFARDSGPDKRCYRVDCDRITNVLSSFKPVWNARLGIRELYRAYQRVGLKLDDFEGGKYKRVAHIRKLLNNGQLDHSLRWQSNEREEIAIS